MDVAFSSRAGVESLIPRGLSSERPAAGFAPAARPAAALRAVVVDESALLRLGLTRMLESMPGVARVDGVDPDELSVHSSIIREAGLLVFGMPHDVTSGWRLLRKLRGMLPAQRVLLLSDNMWLHMPAPEMGYGICCCLPKTAALVTLEAAIGSMLEAEVLAA
ncbi:DNA-binding response regulator [Cupriavidus basilensis]|uniref:DNA-binding response regulator n=1 Tax=Cupriavidus basilensis TaxID=68895 RepID=A0ABT6AZ44_9BURK|nr:DNA-binding response regulator [Cupriavidus basilensis]MDF3837887.1 DNA-binding response regulator [Cupriavidus basilensis]